MKKTSLFKTALPAAMLLAAAAASFADDAIIDGIRDASYGASELTKQNASVIDVILRGPVNAAAQTDNSNVGGVVAYLGGNFNSDPRTVTTGLEMEISLAEAGWDGSSPIYVCSFINGLFHDFLSNQITNGLPTTPPGPPDPDPNPGNPTAVNFNASPNFDGQQYLLIPNTGNGAADPVDGLKGASYPANPLGAGTGWTQLNPTRFGNNTQTARDTAGGSEMNAVWGYRDTKGTPATSDDTLRLLLTGNLQTNGNHWEVFLDVKPGGQSVLAGNPDTNTASGSDQGLARMNGMAFDSSFVADYWVTYTNFVGLGPSNAPPSAPRASAFSCEIPTIGPGVFNVLGDRVLKDNAGAPNPISATGARGLGTISIFIDNSNNLGISSPNGGSGTDPSPIPPLPAAITTGMEFEIGLDQIGYDNSGSIKLGGFITSGSTDFLSNQVIGGLPAGSNSLGSPAGTKDFSVIAGNQYVTLAGIPGSPAALGISVDGTRDAAYGSPLWTNSNATSFGDNTTSQIGDGNGSELDALYAVVSTKNGRRTLHVFLAGNLSNYDRFWLLYDVKSGGQNVIRNDNAFIDDAANGSVGAINAAAGMKFDAAFEPDFITTYHLGLNDQSLLTTHYFDGAELLTNGGPDGDLGGRFAGGDQTANPLEGSIILRTGFGDNTDDATDGITVDADGSELDNVYAQLSTDESMLYVFIGGNLQPNFNKLEIFFDVDPLVGQQRLIYDPLGPGDPGYQGNPGIDNGALNRMGGPVLDGGMPPAPIPGQEGVRFDTAFTADYYLTFTAGNFNSLNTNQAEIYGAYARLRDVSAPNDPGVGRFLGFSYSGDGGFMDGGDLGTSEPVRVDINNTNIGGVDGAANPNANDVSPPGAVATGIEFRIPVADLAPWNGTTSGVKMTIFLNGRNHDFASNQFLPSICSTDIGEPRGINLAAKPGDQYVELAYNAGNRTYTNTRTAPPDCINCPGDANGSGTINGADLSVLLAQFGQAVSPGTGADFNGDGLVNGADLSVLLSNFGGSCS